jgi:Flp pilus assembly protein TadG
MVGLRTSVAVDGNRHANGRERRTRFRSLWSALANQRGQSIVELGIILVLFVTLTFGTIEYGRAWMVANMITHAARDGARAAAVDPAVNRVNGVIQGGTISNVQLQILTQIANVMDPSTIDTPAVQQVNLNGINVVQVTVTGTVPFLFNIFGSGYSVSRIVTCRDEGM